MPLIRAPRAGAAAFLVSALTALTQACPAAASDITPPAPVLTPTTGLVTIESDRQMADNATGIVTAVGNVRIVYPDRRVVATARQAQYYSREGRVVLSGDVEVVQADGNSMRAEQLVYLVDQERLEARPAAGEQVFSRFNLSTPATSGAPASSPPPAAGARR
jgi:lipopolysaccharide export system protein LptA